MIPIAEPPTRQPTIKIPCPRTAQADDLAVTVIEPRRGWQVVSLRELWRYRELFFILAWRDVKVRYKQTVLGTAWTFLQPLATVAVFTLFLGRMGGIAESVPNYALFVLAGVLPWTFFGNAVTAAGVSVVNNVNLVSKIYFPRLLIPVGSVGAGLADLAIGLILLAGLLPWYGVTPGWGILLAPLIIAALTATAVGVGTLFSALIVAHRDFRYVLNFGVQMWMFATPCIYLPASAAGPTAQALLPFNPAYGLILNFRQAVLGGELDWYALSVSTAVGAVILVAGALYFRRVERTFADII